MDIQFNIFLVADPNPNVKPPAKKKPVKYELDEDVANLITKDALNAKLWEDATEHLEEGSVVRQILFSHTCWEDTCINKYPMGDPGKNRLHELMEEMSIYKRETQV